MKNFKSKIAALLFIFGSLIYGAQAQQAYYDVSSGNGKGLRFWNGSDTYKIHMGSLTEYQYGPVTDYSIKVNMSSHTGRGWTWGVNGLEPVAALANSGDMQIKGIFTSMQGLGVGLNTLGSYKMVVQQNASASQQGIRLLNENQSRSLQFWVGSNEAVIDAEGSTDFHLKTGGVTRLFADNNGGVGIGTQIPVQKLDIAGITYLRNASTHGVEVEQLRIGRIDHNSRYHSIYSKHSGSTVANYLQFRIHDGNGTSQTTVMHMTGAGHVGIGTTDTHGYELAVAGGVLAEKVYLEQQANWPDYVFNSKYNLRSLEETEAFIEENHHLPEIPSAQEVESNGYDLGQMNAKLLQKIEELTLYLIDQNNKLQNQDDLIKTLQSDVEKLKSTADN